VTIGYLLAAVAMTALGSSVAASALLVDYPVFTGQALRYGLATVILVALARGRLLRPDLPQLLQLAALAALGLAGFNVLLIAALGEADPAVVAVVVGAVPVVLAVVGPVVSGERLSRRVLGAAVVVTAGVAAVQWGEPRFSALGLLFALGALACEAAFSLLAVPLLGRLRPIGVATYASALAVPMLLATAIVADGGGAFVPPRVDDAAALVYLAVVVTAAAFVAWYSAIERVGAARAGLFAGLVPIAALATLAGIGLTLITPLRLVGALVVCGGVLLGVSRPVGGRYTARWEALRSPRRGPPR
jgi:drug/metabolite transporter (DMT)-like permease